MYIMEKNKSPVVLAKRCGYYLCPNPERRAVHWCPGEGGGGGGREGREGRGEYASKSACAVATTERIGTIMPSTHTAFSIGSS